MPEENLSSLERLKKVLESEGQEPGMKPGIHVPETSMDYAQTGWAPPPPPTPKKKIPRSVFFLIGAAIFFVLASIVAVLFLFFGTRSVSTDRVDVSIDGPATIASGDAVQFVVTVENRNPAPIGNTLLTVEYPPGTRSADNPEEELVRYSDTVGDVQPGEKVTRTARAVISGAANTVVTVPVTLEYRIEGSNATFQKKEEHSFTITNSPVSLSVQTLGESASGQPITLVMSVRANGVDPVPNVGLEAVYPFGFQVTGTDPAPVSGNFFDMGTLVPGDTKTVRVTGVLSGQQNDERVFRATAGSMRPGASAISVPFTTQESTVLITRPFLGINLQLNREPGETVIAKAGTPVLGNISWANSLPTPVLDAEVTVKLSGDALDTRTVSTASGFYRSSDQTIVYSRDTIPLLRRLEPGDNGSGSFTVPMKTGAALAALRNPTITFTVSVTGKRTGESGVQEEVRSTLTKTVQVMTDLAISSRAVRTIGPFPNTGPWPPRPDTETTYTILLSASNSVNSVGGAKVVGRLPSYVTFTGKVEPADGSVTYNASTREVTWSIGDMPAGTTNRTAAFQVSLLPSTSQRGTSPVLVFPQTISGTDRFVKKQVTGSAPETTTRATTDPAFVSDYGEVAE